MKCVIGWNGWLSTGVAITVLAWAQPGKAVVPVLGETPQSILPPETDNALVKLRIDQNLHGSIVGPTVNFDIATSNLSTVFSAAALPSHYADGTNRVANQGHAHVYATYLDSGQTFHQTNAFLGANVYGVPDGATTLHASITLPRDGRWLIVSEAQYWDHTARIRSNPQGWGAWDAAVVTVQGSTNQTLTARGENPADYPNFATYAPVYTDNLPVRVAFAPALTGSTVTGLSQSFQVFTQNLYVDYAAAASAAEYAQGDRDKNFGHVNIYGTYLGDGGPFHETNLFLGKLDFASTLPSLNPTLTANIIFPTEGPWLLAAEAVYNDETGHVRPHPQVWGTWDFAFVTVSAVPEPDTFLLAAVFLGSIAALGLVRVTWPTVIHWRKLTRSL